MLWMNGDVVFDPRRAAELRPSTSRRGPQRSCASTPQSVAEEEVKYTVDAEGYINELSKRSSAGSARPSASTTSPPRDKAALIERLDEVDDQDYFERGIELAIEPRTACGSRRSTSPSTTSSRSTSPRTSTRANEFVSE